MELRVLRYFLMAAREENITRAAQLLHLTQPTLSRQLIQLEEELGVTLFRRSKQGLTLTPEGMLLKRRAQELLALSDKTTEELSHRGNTISGTITLGCGETNNMQMLAEQMARFRQLHPLVRFSIYSATADEIQDRLENGLVELGLLMEPVEIARYDFVRMPCRERWGVLVPKHSPLARQGMVTPQDLAAQPLIMPQRESVQNQLYHWLGKSPDQLEIAGEYNLMLNAAAMVQAGVGVAPCFDLGAEYRDQVFLPFQPPMENGAVLVWKKNQVMADPAARFAAFLNDAFRA